MLSLPFFIRFAAGANFFAQVPLVDSFPSHNDEGRAAGSLASFIASEDPIALQGVLNNIGSGGALAPGVQAGLVVASPSMADPDCQFFPSMYLQPSYLSPVLSFLLHLWMYSLAPTKEPSLQYAFFRTAATLETLLVHETYFIYEIPLSALSF